MAFVYRNQQPNSPMPSTPGPGHYRCNQPKEERTASAPFHQTSSRKIWNQNMNPGPASYSIEPEQKGANFPHGNRVNSASSAAMSVFKSAAQRFTVQRTKDDAPGPGLYILDETKPTREKTMTQQSHLQKYLKRVHQHQKVQTDEGPFMIGDQEDSCQADKKEAQLKKKVEKKVVPFNYSVGRDFKTRPKTSLGPGSYQLQNKKVVRQNEESRYLNRKEGSHSLAKFKTVQKKTVSKEQANLDLMFTSQKSQHGSSAIFKKSNQKKEDFFGSTVSRFYRTEKDLTPGPGDYNCQNAQQNGQKPKKSHVCFGRSSTSPPQYTHETFVSPFSLGKINQKPKIKKQKSIKGSFGSNQARFRQSKENAIDISSSEHIQIGKVADKQIMSRKSHKRYLFQQKVIERANEEVDQRPLIYANDCHTLQKKVGYRHQMNAPFSTQVPRFEQNRNKTITEQILHRAQQSDTQKINRKAPTKSESKGFMESQGPRFDYKQKQNSLSPWTYDPCRPLKKQFNKLFM